MSRTQLFDSSPEGKRRSVLFAIGTVVGFICVVAAASAYARSAGNVTVAAALVAVGLGAFAFAVLVFLGRFESLVEGDQLLWRFAGRGN